MKSLCERLIRTFDIAVARPDAPVQALSGGNLQKLLFAREVDDNPTLLVVEYPTRGLDVGAAAFVRQALLDQRKRGAAILLVSESLEELANLSDRIVVLFEGRIQGEVAGGEVDLGKLGLWMAGETADVAL